MCKCGKINEPGLEVCAECANGVDMLLGTEIVLNDVYDEYCCTQCQQSFWVDGLDYLYPKYCPYCGKKIKITR